MWLLLQPRGHLGGFFLFIALGGGALGLIFGGKTIEYPAFIGWESLQGQPLFPLLFVTIACGACSGFHSMIASGTTSKQLRRETDARLVGYGTMLMEGMVAVVSLACVMMLRPSDDLITGPGNPKPNLLYAQGIGSFLAVLGIPASFGVSFGLMAFTTFVYDTLDVCTRLGRYILQELTGWNTRVGRAVCTAATAGVPLVFLMRQPIQGGKVTPTWRVFWDLFGASNQLLAALTLIGVTVWLWQTRRALWVWFVTGLPAVLMYLMSTWALGRIIYSTYLKTGAGLDLVAWVAVVLLALAALMLVEAILVVFGGVGPTRRHGAPALAAG
jgi:carbon starvation protein